MRAPQPRRHIVEEWFDLKGDTARRQRFGNGNAVLLAGLLSHTQPGPKLRGQLGQRRRHGLAEDPRALAAADDQQFDRRRRPWLYGAVPISPIAGRTGLPV